MKPKRRIHPKSWYQLTMCLLTIAICTGGIIAGSTFINLDFRETDIREVLRAVSLQTGKNIIADPEITGLVTVHLSEVPFEEGLDYLLSSYGWFMEKRGDIYRVRRGLDDHRLRIECDAGLLDISVWGVPLREVLLAMADVCGVSLVPHLDEDETIYVRLNGHGFEESLDYLMRGHQLMWRQENGVYLVETDYSSSDEVTEPRVEAPVLGESSLWVSIADGAVWMRAFETPVADLLQILGEAAEANLVVDSQISAKARVVFHGVEIASAIEQLVSAYELTVTEKDTVLHIRPNTKSSGTSAIEGVYFQDDLLTVDVRNVSLTELVGAIARELGVTVYVEGGTDAVVTLYVKDVPAWEAFEVIADLTGFKLQRTNNSYVLTDPGLAQNSPLHLVINEFGSVNLYADDVSVKQVLSELAYQSDLNLVISSQVDSSISMMLRNVQVNDALQTIVDAAGLQIVEAAQHLQIIPKEPLSKDIPSGPNPDVSQSCVEIDSAGLLTLSAEDVSVRRVLSELAIKCSRNLIISSDVQEEVSLVLNSVTWDAALENVLSLVDLDAIEIDGMLRVTPRKEISLPTGIESFEVDDGIVWLNAVDVPVVELLQVLGETAEIDFIVEPGITVRTRAMLHGVPATAAFEQIATGHGLVVERDGSMLRVKAPSKLQTDDPEVTLIDGLLTVDVVQMPLSELVHKIGRSAGIFVYIEGGSDTLITTYVHNVTVEEAFVLLSRLTGFTLQQRDIGYVLTAPGLHDASLELSTDASGLVSVHAEDVSVRQVLSKLALEYGQNIVLSSKVEGTASLVLDHVTWEEAFQAILDTANLDIVEEDGVLRITPQRKEPSALPLGIEFLQVEEGLVWLRAYDASLADVLQVIGEAADLSFAIDTEISAKARVILNGVGASTAFKQLVQTHDLILQEEDQIVWVRPAASPKMNESVSRVSFTEEHFTVDALDQSLSTLVRQMAQAAGVSVYIKGGTEFPVTLCMYEVPIRDAFQAVARLAGFDLEQSGSSYVFTPHTPANEDSMDISVNSSGLISIRAENASVRKVISELALQSGRNIAVSVTVQGEVDLVVHDMDVNEALLTVVQVAGLQMDESMGILQITAKADSVDHLTETSDEDALSWDQDLPLQMRRLASGLVSVKAVDVSVRQVLTEVALQLGCSLVLAPEVEGDVNIVLYEVEQEEVLQAVLTVADLVSEEVSGIVRVLPKVDLPKKELPAEISLLRVEDGMLTTHLREVSLDQFLDELLQRFPEEKCLMGLVIDRNVNDIKISGAVAGLKFQTALESLIRPYDLQLVEIDDGYRIERRPSPKSFSISYQDDLLDVTAHGAPLKDVLTAIGKETGVTFIMPQVFPYQVSVALEQLSPQLAVEILLEPHGYLLEQLGQESSGSWSGILRISQPSPIKVTYLDDVLFVDAQEVALNEVIREISLATGANILIEPGGYPKVTLKLGELPLDEMLRVIVTSCGGTVLDLQNHYIVQMTPPQLPASPITPVLSKGINCLEIDEDGIEVAFQGVPLGELLADIYHAGGPRLVPDRGIQDERLTGHIAGDVPFSAVCSFLYDQGYTVFPLPDRFLVRGKTSGPLVHWEKDQFYLDIPGGDLVPLIREMASKAGQSVVIYPAVRGNVSNLRLSGVTFQEGLGYLLKGTTFSLLEADGIYFIGEGVIPRSDSPGFTQSKVISLKHILPSNLISLVPPSIPSQNIKVMPGQSAVVVFGNPEVIESIQEFVLTVDQPPDTQMTIVPIRFADPQEVTNAIAQRFTSDLFHYIDSQKSVLLTGSPEVNKRIEGLIKLIDTPAAAVRTEVIPLWHINADDAKRYLNHSIDSSRILVIAEQNSLVVTGTEDYISSVCNYLKQIDIRNPQIVFDVMIVEINDRTNTQLGFTGQSEDGILQFDLLAKSPLTLSLGSAWSASSRITLLLSTLIQEGKAKLLANPTLTTLNGKEASFNVLTTTRYWSPETSTDQDGEVINTVPVFRSIETGIRLRLRPWVSASGEITIELNPEISDSAGTSSSSGLPSTNDRSVSTTVRVKDGETIVIGGLIQQSKQHEVSAVPVLGQLPIIGRLFRSETVGEIETEFVIAITSHLVDFEMQSAP